MDNILLKNILYRFKKDKVALVSLIFFVFFTVFIFVTYILYGRIYLLNDDSFFMYAKDILCSPSKLHIFGTDDIGRDIFIRTIIGSFFSIVIAFVATVVTVVIGSLYGMIAGFYGGKIDNYMMRFVDGLYAIPFIFLTILFTAIFGNNFLLIFISIACVSWLDIARIVRGLTMAIRKKEFIDAAKISGLNNLQIIYWHIFPNLLGHIITYSIVTVPNILSLSTFLGFLGFGGIQPPKVGLGELINYGSQYIIFGYWWLLVFPCLFLFLILLSLFFIGNGIKNAINFEM